MQPNPFEEVTDAAELAGRVLARLRTRGDAPVVDEHSGDALADRIAGLAADLGDREVRPGELVTVAAAEPVHTVIGCLAAWLAGATPWVGPADAPARLELLAAHGSVRVHPYEATCVDTALVVSETLVGCVAHPLGSLGRLALPAETPAAVQLLADWRVDAWLPLVVGAWLAGVDRLSLRAADTTAAADPSALLACPAVRFTGAPALTGPGAYAAWLSWGSGCPDRLPPAEQHHHGFGDHFVLAATRPQPSGGERSVRGRVYGRHRICNPAGRPLPANAWGRLALAGRLPVIGDTVDSVAEAVRTEPGERTWVTDYRARKRSDGSIEFDLRELDPLRFAGRRLAPAPVARLLATAGLTNAALLARDPDSDRARLVLCAAGSAPGSATGPDTVERLTAALPAWAAPLGVTTLPALPRDADGEVDLARLSAAAPPDDWLLEHTERALTGDRDTPVRLRAVPVRAETDGLPLPDGFAAGGGHYPGTRLAEATGPELAPPPGDLIARLQRAAGTGRGLLLIDAEGDEQPLSYRALLTGAARVAAYLREQGVAPGSELIVHCPRPADLFTGIWACILLGVLPVPLTPATPYDAASNPLWHLLGPDTMLTGRAILTTEAQRDATAPVLDKRGLSAGMLTLEAAQAYDPLPAADWTPRPPALMLLTSGSTGAPKGVALSHRNLVSLAEAIRGEFGLDGETSLNWLAVDHVGGLVQHHMRDLCLAHDQIHVDTGYALAEPTRLLDLCDKHRVTITWMANFGFNLINEQAEKIAQGSWDLSAIKVWENGGEAVTHEGNQRFLALLAPHGLRPDVIKPVFGMTETSSAIIGAHNLVAGRQDYVHWLSDTALDSPVERALPGEGSPFAEVGGPMAGISMRVVDAGGRVCPEGVSGRIEVRGPQIMDGYYRNPKADAETFTDDGWLRMGDCGFMVDGSLVVTGREKDVIIVNGLNYAARALENTIEAVPGIRQGCCAAVSVRPADAVTDDLVVFYSSAAGASADAAAVEAALISEHNLRPVALVELDPEQWPRTAIGKIRRQPLAQGFLAGEFAERIALRRDSGLGERVSVPAWHFVPHWEPAAAAPAGAARVLWLGEQAPAGAALAATSGAPFDGFDAGGRARYRAGHDGDTAALLAAATERLGGLDAVVEASWRTAATREDADSAVRALSEAHTAWDALCRAAAQLPAPPAITFATRAAAVVTGTEPSIAYAALPGVAESLGQSHPQLRIALVDGAPDDALLTESAVRGHTQVAYRDGVRLVRALRPLPAPSIPATPRRVLREGASYLVVGGLGGVGAHLCRHLLRQFGARLLVVGRSPAEDGDPRAQTLAYLSDQAGSGGGSEIRYEALDATDPDALRAAVEAAEKEWGGPLDAVFNLVGEGSVAEQLDALTSPGQADSDRLRRRAADRIRLCHTLDAVLRDRSTSLVTFSSVNGFFGGAGFTDYAGACAYQAAYSAWSGRRGGRENICLDWSMWKQVGMAAGAPSTLVGLAERRGFAALTPAQGLASLHLALDSEEQRTLIGLSAAGDAVAGLLPFDTVRYAVEADSVDDPAEVAELLDLPPASVRCVRTAARRTSAVSVSHTASLLAVFRDVLARPELSEEDNFFASGGDSIRAIQVVARAAERGFTFSPLDLFEHKTVGALLTHLADHDRLDEVPLDDEAGDSTTPVPLPPVFAWWLEKAEQPAVRDHLTMSMRYQLDGGLEPAQVEAALAELVGHHDALRLRLVEEPEGLRLTTGEAAADSLRFEVHDLSADSCKEGPRADGIESGLHRGVNPGQGPVVRAALLRFTDRPYAHLVVVIHHAAVDGVSWRIIEEDLRLLLDAQRGASDGAGTTLPARTLGFMDWARRVARRAQQVDGRALADAWLARLDRPSGTLPGTPAPAEPLREADTEILNRTVPSDTLGRLADASVNEVLLTAVGWSLAEWMGADAVTLDVEGHGRLQRDMPVDLSRTVGWFTSIAPLCLDMAGCAAPAEALQRVRRATNELRGRDLEWGMLRYLDACPPGHPLRSLPERQVSFNYLGVFDSSEETDALLTTVPGSLGAEQSPDAERHYLIDIAAQVSGGQLEFAVKYSPEVHATADVERWLDRCETTLRQLLTGDADADVADIDQDELLLALEEVGFGTES
ncbi:SDR family NAD(P)-dependent oxidoreductase [Streptomyces sp. 7N604]|uniref:SDR family NAD(P)-dependent oxidoreductase n=1 Tax=Streptomyces sp. 7N604 TaxID=3457415 RepID=UPI003FD480F5